jgi:hypothetical protein
MRKDPTLTGRPSHPDQDRTVSYQLTLFGLMLREPMAAGRA